MKKGQVWVETVIYTLIAFVMIAAVLSFVKPKIQEFQDKSTIEQTITLLKDINNLLLSVAQGGPGNRRIIELNVKEGIFKIDGKNDTLSFEIESAYTYSEPGVDIDLGNIIVNTKKRGDYNIVTLKTDYSSNYNITYNKLDDLKLVNKAATPYKFAIENRKESGGRSEIDFKIV